VGNPLFSVAQKHRVDVSSSWKMRIDQGQLTFLMGKKTVEEVQFNKISEWTVTPGRAIQLVMVDGGRRRYYCTESQAIADSLQGAVQVGVLPAGHTSYAQSTRAAAHTASNARSPARRHRQRPTTPSRSPVRHPEKAIPPTIQGTAPRSNAIGTSNASVQSGVIHRTPDEVMRAVKADASADRRHAPSALRVAITQKHLRLAPTDAELLVDPMSKTVSVVSGSQYHERYSLKDLLSWQLHKDGNELTIEHKRFPPGRRIGFGCTPEDGAALATILASLVNTAAQYPAHDTPRDHEWQMPRQIPMGPVEPAVRPTSPMSLGTEV
jgi:hypothetical protein